MPATTDYAEQTGLIARLIKDVRRLQRQGLNTLRDVDPTGLANGDVPVWDDTSKTWKPGTPSSSAGGYTLIASSVLSSAAASIDFSSIPSTYNHLRLMVRARSAKSATADILALRVNNISTNIYKYRGVSATNASINTFGFGGDSWYQAAQIPAATGTANYAGTVIIDLPCYALTAFYKTFISAGGEGDDATNQANYRALTGSVETTAAINRLTLLSTTASTNLVAGSAAYLYGLT